MILADTNVCLALFVETEHSADARRLYQHDPQWLSEPLLFHELTNVLNTLCRVKRIDLPDAQLVLRRAQQVLAGSLKAVTDSDALATAALFGISGYDARFIVLARALGVKLTTEDRRLRAAVPDYTQSLAEALTP